MKYRYVRVLAQQRELEAQTEEGYEEKFTGQHGTSKFYKAVLRTAREFLFI